MKFLSFDFTAADCVPDAEARQELYLARKDAEAAMRAGEAPEEDLDDVIPAVTTEVRSWCINEENERCLVRFQRVPVHGYLELPREAPGGGVWTRRSAARVVNWVENVLGSARNGNYSLLHHELVTRDKLHFYKPESFGLQFLLLYFNTNKAAKYMESVITGQWTSKRTPCEPKMVCIEQGTPPIPLMLHEVGDVDLVIRYMTALRKIDLCQWFDVKVRRITSKYDRIAQNSSVKEYFADWCSIEPVVGMSHPVPYRVLSFDIEVNSSIRFPGSMNSPFPDARNHGDCIFMFSLVTQTGPDVNTKKKILLTTVPVTEKERDFEVRMYKNEPELLEAFQQFILDYDCDIMTGHNINGFDIPYIYDRIAKVGLVPMNIGRLKKYAETSKYTVRLKEGKKSELITTHSLKVPGRIVFDLLPFMKRSAQGAKLRSYKLDAIAEMLLKEGKLEVSAQEMFDAYLENREARKALAASPDDPVLLARVRAVEERFDLISEYCIVDSDLVLRLFEKLVIWPQLSEFSNIMGVTMSMLYQRGEQIRVFSQIITMAIAEDFVIDRHAWDIIQVAGAIVQDPIKGVHDNVMCFDFKSLYPSIMRMFNICYSTMIPKERWSEHNEKDCHIFIIEQDEPEDVDPNAKHVIIGADFESSGGLDDTKVESLIGSVDENSEQRKYIETVEDGGDEKGTEKEPERDVSGLVKLAATVVRKGKKAKSVMRRTKREVRFVRQKTREGILPKILARLVAERGATRKLQKIEYEKNGESFEWHRLEARQLALKVTANALYGFTGCQLNGMLPLPMGFICVTTRGRQLIETVNDRLRRKYRATVVYGDTDSTMFTITGVEGAECLTRGEEIKKEINDYIHSIIDPTLPMIVEMEMEKAMRMVLFKKKQYAYYLIGKDGTFIKDSAGENDLNVKGIKIARRDNCQFQLDIFQDAIVQLLEGTPPTTIVKNTVDVISKVLAETEPLQKYAINKGTKVYDQTSKSSMKILMDTMASLGAPIAPGDRVFYINASPESIVGRTLSERALTVDWCEQQQERPKINEEWYLFDALIKMNEILKMSFDYWAKKDPQRLGLDERIEMTFYKQTATRLNRRTVNFAKAPMFFISNAALYGRCTKPGKEERTAAFLRFGNWLCERIESQVGGHWEAMVSRPKLINYVPKPKQGTLNGFFKRV